MIDWVANFMKVSLPSGNLIVELSTQKMRLRCPLNDFMTQWTESSPASCKTCMLTGQRRAGAVAGPSSHLQYSRQHCHSQSRQDIQVLENNMTDLKVLLISRRIKRKYVNLWIVVEVRMTTDKN